MRKRARIIGGAIAVLLPTVATVGGAATPARADQPGAYVLFPAQPFRGLPGLLVDTVSGAATEVGDAVAASDDGRYLVRSNGDRVDRQTNVVYHPDLTAALPVGWSVLPTDVSLHGEVYTLLAQAPTPPGTTATLVVDPLAGTVVNVPESPTGLSPSGRYLAVRTGVIDLQTGQRVTAADPGALYGPVTDESVFRRTTDHGRVQTFAGTTIFDAVSFARGGPRSGTNTDGLSVGLLAYGGYYGADDVYAFSATSGARLLLERGAAFGGSNVAWDLSPNSDVAVRASWTCTAPDACTYGPVGLRRGIRMDLLVAAAGSAFGADVRALRLAGIAGVPHGATAVLLNVTVDDAAAGGYVTVWPCGQERPLASNLDYAAHQTIAAAVPAVVDPSGWTCLFTSTPASVIVDVNGWFDLPYRPVTPKRLLDTRTAGPRVLGEVRLRSADFGGSTTVLDVAATDATADGFVTVWPCDRPRPLASNLNVAKGATVANLAVTGVAPNDPADHTDDEVCLWANQPMHLVVDVEGAIDDGFTSFVDVPPTRLLDTRAGRTRSAGPALAPGTTTTLTIVRPDGGPVAVGDTAILNVTATNPAAAGYVTVHPCSTDPRPLASNLNHAAGETIANAVFAIVGTGGAVCLYNQSATDLVVDLDGYVPAIPVDGNEASFVGLVPVRVLDTRLDAPLRA